MFRWPISVYYEDTDAGGLVYHSNYLKYFERARSEWLRELGISQTHLLRQDTAFVVRHAELDFCRGARFEQQLFVDTYVSEFKRASLIFEHKLVDSQGNCYCQGKIVIAFVNLMQMRPKAIPQHIMQELQGGS